jgi:hypothetical protein
MSTDMIVTQFTILFRDFPADTSENYQQSWQHGLPPGRDLKPSNFECRAREMPYLPRRLDSGIVMQVMCTLAEVML